MSNYLSLLLLNVQEQLLVEHLNPRARYRELETCPAARKLDALVEKYSCREKPTFPILNMAQF